MAATPQLSAGALLLRPDLSVLLQLRDEKPGIYYPGFWMIPSGALEPGESPLDGAVRELHEETGYVMRDPKPLPVYQGLLPDGVPVTRYVFWDLYDGIQPVRVFEGQAMQFVARHDLASRLLVPGNEVTIDHCLAAYETLRNGGRRNGD